MTLNPEFVWGTWLLLFLCYEVYAAVNKRKGDTLSEVVWDWTGRRGVRRFAPLRRSVLGFFMGVLIGHLVWGAPVWPVIVTGIALGAVILWGIFKEK